MGKWAGFMNAMVNLRSGSGPTFQVLCNAMEDFDQVVKSKLHAIKDLSKQKKSLKDLNERKEALYSIVEDKNFSLDVQKAVNKVVKACNAYIVTGTVGKVLTGDKYNRRPEFAQDVKKYVSNEKFKNYGAHLSYKIARISTDKELSEVADIP